MTEPGRDPDILLSRLKEEELRSQRGRLKIFFGAVAGVGKTYSMLETAKILKEQGIDVVAGYVETHGRKETAALLEGLELLPLRSTEYNGTQLKEFDIDAALKRKPEVILLDELAHTNAPNSRHAKRWQDALELIEAGIDVLSTLNVQHVESLHDVVAQITRISIHERVPDLILEKASDIELIDLPPEELLERLKDGKIYLPERAQIALENFFRKGNLIALRELALRYTAQRVVAAMDQYRQEHKIKAPWPASEKILVCVSPSPLAPRLVRSGKRMAEALRANWIVVYIEGTRQLLMSNQDKTRIIQTLRLAEQLGAQTLELSGKNIADEVIKCAKQYNISKIIIGKPARPRWKEALLGSVVDDVIRNSGATDVYVITGEENTGALGARKARQFISTSKRSKYFWALAQVLVCTTLAKLVLPYLELSNVIMIFLLGVVTIAMNCGRGPSILSSILSVAAFDFFFVPPFLTFAVSDTQYLITFLVMLVVALIISQLTVTTRQQANTARLKEMRTAALYSMSRELASSVDKQTLIEIGLRHIGDVFDSRVALFLPNTDDNLKVEAMGQGKRALNQTDEGVAVWCYRNKQPAGLGTDTLPGANELYVPLPGAEKPIGVLAISPNREERFMSPEQLRLLETFASQLALAWQRAQLAEQGEQARLQIRAEQLRNSLLSSVSHDLRTPLATITGAASSIIEGTESFNLDSCKEMAKEIYNESLRLNRLVSNLLDMTKLQAGMLVLHLELYPVDEIIGAALSCTEERLINHTLTTKIAPNLPLMQVDEILIQQVLVNLLENAIKYTPTQTEIELAAMPYENQVLISVADRGPGIPQENHKRIFEKFFRGATSTTTGAGLGLAICGGIIEAHGGKIWVENRPGGGSIFKFTVPASTHPLNLEAEDTAQIGGESHA